MYHKKKKTKILYLNPTFLKLLNDIIYFIVNSVAVSSERTAAFATPQIS